jgi:hypothetical protein
MNVLIDTNILLDVLLKRSPWSTESSAIWQACDNGRIVGDLPASTLTDIFTLRAVQRILQMHVWRLNCAFKRLRFAQLIARQPNRQ